MNALTSRRRFLAQAAPGIGLASWWAGSASAALGEDKAAAGSADLIHDRFPQQDAEAVRETVGVAHFDLDKLRKLVDRRPALVNATQDWGFGDWETALGAASHVGRPDIAEYLLANGARIDIFAAAMLGHLDVVRGLLTARPEIARNRGPHGITLMAHAEAGEARAKAVVEYLKGVPGCNEPEPGKVMSAAEGAAYLGVYRAAGGRELVVKESKPGITLAIGESRRVMRGTGNHVFHPAGAPAVSFTFTVEGDRATAVEVRDATLVLRATRV